MKCEQGKGFAYVSRDLIPCVRSHVNEGTAVTVWEGDKWAVRSGNTGWKNGNSSYQASCKINVAMKKQWIQWHWIVKHWTSINGECIMKSISSTKLVLGNRLKSRGVFFSPFQVFYLVLGNRKQHYRSGQIYVIALNNCKYLKKWTHFIWFLNIFLY